MLSITPRPLLLKQQPGREELARSSVVQANDLHSTLELERLSAKAGRVSISFEGGRQRDGYLVID